VRLEIAPGLEPFLQQELAELGIEARVDKGGVETRLDAAGLMHVQRESRIASRATIRLGNVGAESLEVLADRVRKLPWSLYVHPRQPLDIHVTSSRSRLRRRDRVSAKVELAIGDALKGPRRPGGRPPREPVRVLVRIENDKATLRVDASGELLHKRGWRQAVGRAPIRENLAAALLRAARWQPGEPLVDAMCGSGTFPIEAALWTLGRPPGSHRRFACENWPCWSAPPIRNRPPGRDAGALIMAADRDPRATERTLDNARRARVEARITVATAALRALPPQPGPGLVVANPPWGSRLGQADELAKLYSAWSNHLRAEWPEWRVLVVVPDTSWGRRAWGSEAETAAHFESGGTKVIALLRTPPSRG
jgi:putative N6-adenine-specific DNA methylase